MAEVAVNYNVNIKEVAANMSGEGFQSAGDDTIWITIEGAKDMDSCDEDSMAKAAGAGQDADLKGLGFIPTPKKVDKTSPHEIKTG